MNKVIIALSMVLFFTGICFAEISTAGLTKEMEAQLIIQAEQMKKSVGTTEQVNQWVDVGKNIGMAITSVAKELGVAVDSFMNTTTGKITMGLIIYKVIGRDLIHIMVGISLLITLLSLWVYFFRKLCVIKSITIEYPTEKFKKIKRVEHYRADEVDGTRLMMLFALAGIIGVGLLIIFG